MSQRILDLHESEIGALVSSAIPHHISVTELSCVIRELVREEIPVRQIGLIIQAIIEPHVKPRTVRTFVEEARIALRKTIVQVLEHKKHDRPERGKSPLLFASVDPAIDILFTQCEIEQRTAPGQLMRSLREHIIAHENEIDGIIVSRHSRAFVRDYLRVCDIGIPVVSFDEFKEVHWQSIGVFNYETDEVSLHTSLG
jgi:flagellar biosynthesis component FlhA